MALPLYRVQDDPWSSQDWSVVSITHSTPGGSGYLNRESGWGTIL